MGKAWGLGEGLGANGRWQMAKDFSAFGVVGGGASENVHNSLWL
jgi:hypothetical protein